MPHHVTSSIDSPMMYADIFEVPRTRSVNVIGHLGDRAAPLRQPVGELDLEGVAVGDGGARSRMRAQHARPGRPGSPTWRRGSASAEHDAGVAVAVLRQRAPVPRPVRGRAAGHVAGADRRTSAPSSIVGEQAGSAAGSCEKSASICTMTLVALVDAHAEAGAVGVAEAVLLGRRSTSIWPSSAPAFSARSAGAVGAVVVDDQDVGVGHGVADSPQEAARCSRLPRRSGPRPGYASADVTGPADGDRRQLAGPPAVREGQRQRR